MKTSLFGLPERDMTFMQGIDYAKELGLDALEPYPRAELLTPDTAAARRIAEYAATRDIKICCFSITSDLSQSDNSEEITKLMRYADVTAALGAKYLHHTLCPIYRLSPAQPRFDEALERIVPAAQQVFDYAQSVGVTCVYEDQGYIVNGSTRFDAFFSALNRPAGVVADLGNSLFVGESAEVFVGRMGPLIRHVHVKDYLIKPAAALDPGANWYRAATGQYLRGTIIGHGDVPFTTIFRMLREVGYDGYYSMEFDGMENPRTAHALGLENMRRFYDVAQMSQL